MITMDDKFLYQLREQPDSEFVKNLQKKLTQDQSAPKWRLKMNFKVFSMNRKVILAWVTTLVMVSLLAVATISPVRAYVSSLLTSIAGQSFEVTDDYPGDNYPGDETVFEPQVMSLVEAYTAFPHNISMPTNVPNEFILDEENVSVYTGENVGPFSDTIKIQWKTSTGAYLTLDISNHDWSTLIEVVAPDSIEEVFLNDENTAVLIKGGWDADKKMWNNELGILRLRWQVDDLVYDLHGNIENITVEQLIVIALSTLE